MKVLVACEESQEVCKAFRAKGHEAYSADIQEPSGGHPEWHILGNVLPIIDGDCKFTTMDGEEHEVVGEWDLLIAHPLCTYLTNAGARHIWKNHQLQPDRVKLGIQARDLFMRFWWANASRIAIENPVPSSVFCLPEYSQIVQPFWVGHAVTKKTCLWLKNLPLLVPTEVIEPIKGREMILKDGTVRRSCWEMEQKGSKEQRAKARSKTFPGIAKAMAEQWG